LLDLACGTGTLSEEMARRGFDVIGVDNSEDMLSIALDKKFDSGLPIQYLCQDMCELDMYGTIDVTICALDSLNHLADINSVKRAIERVSLFTNPNGLFIFDINTIYKHKNILGNNTFIYDTDEVFCVWQNTYNEKDNSVLIELNLFEKDEDVYRRFDESFSEKAYDVEMIKQICENAGLELINIYDYMTKNPPRDDSEKLTFITRKVR
jgi:SAM-dependent methyltransferase